MPSLSDVCDPDLLVHAVAEGLVSTQTDGHLTIFNYTNKAAYGRFWNDATTACRGLIVDRDGRIVARPFPKFFGVSEPDAPPLPAT